MHEGMREKCLGEHATACVCLSVRVRVRMQLLSHCYAVGIDLTKIGSNYTVNLQLKFEWQLMFNACETELRGESRALGILPFSCRTKPQQPRSAARFHSDQNNST